MRKWSFFLVLLILFSNGCNSIGNKSTLSTSAIQSDIPTHSVIPSTTAARTTNPTSTRAPTIAPTQNTSAPPKLKKLGYQKVCLLNIEGYRSGFISNGMLILESVFDNKSYILSEDSETPKQLPDIYTQGFLTISLDGRWNAESVEINDSSGNSIKVVEVRSFDGQQRKTIPMDEYWRSPIYWIDSERVAIDLWKEVEPQDDWISNYGEAFLNVFTEEISQVDAMSLEYFNMPGTSPLYNPGLSRVLYPRYEPFEWPSLALMDLGSHKILWRIEVWDTVWFIHPQWSPDGERFVVGGPIEPHDSTYELMIIDQDGQVLFQSNFQEAGFRELAIYNPQWSPNGRYVAFWFGNSLAIFDTVKEITIDYCISSDDPKGYKPFWSPDSRQIALISNLSSNENSTTTIIVDIDKQRAVEIDQRYYVIGWMEYP